MFESAEVHGVPPELTLVYELLGSLDERSFVRHGRRHTGGDQWATPEEMRRWFVDRGLLAEGDVMGASARGKARRLRAALRSVLSPDPGEREGGREQIDGLASKLPVAVTFEDGAPALRAVRAGAVDRVLTRVLADLVTARVAGTWARLKMCRAPDCRDVFYDRSRPGSAKWCSSAACGNRHKTASYRGRVGSR